MNNKIKKIVISCLFTLVVFTVFIPFFTTKASASYISEDSSKPVFHDGVWAYQIEDGYAILVGTSEVQRGESCGPPSYLGGYPLKVISGVNCGAIAAIRTEQFIIPPGVERIEGYAFNTSNFTSVVMPRSLTFIGFNAFVNCYNFNTIYYEGSATTFSNIDLDDFPNLGNKLVINATKYYGYMYDESYYQPIKEYNILGRCFNKNLDYYIDNFNSSVYSPEFSNMLAALSKAVYDQTEITKAYEELGYTDMSAYGFSFYDDDRCSYVIGSKKSDYNDDKICLITFQGSSNLSDWLCNLDITTYEDKHQGFLVSATLAKNEILAKYGTLDGFKFIITGHSRGAAVGNLLAVMLMEQGVSPENVYNYNYACPDVVYSDNIAHYTNIFNFCNTDDIVPFVPGLPFNVSSIVSGKYWKKYGQTFWFTKDVEGFFASHSMSLYLDFFDQRLNIGDWPYEFESKNSGMLTKVFCPVDVTLTDENGELIASVINGEITYSTDYEREIVILIEGDKKIIYINGDVNYDVNLVGTDTGTMTFSIEKINTNEVLESKSFSNVSLESGKTMYASVTSSKDIDDVELFVVRDVFGENVFTHEISTSGTEEIILCGGTCVWSDGIITKSPTHTEFGEITYFCRKCAAISVEQLKKTTSHSYIMYSMNNDTAHTLLCACGEYEIEKHTFSEWVVTKEATENESGIKERTCSCGYSVTEKIPSISDNSNSDESNHVDCTAGWWRRLWVSLGNFFRRIFRLPEKCVCGETIK